MLDEEKIFKGLVPWSSNGFKEINNDLAQLFATPRDDWDLTETKIVLGDGSTRDFKDFGLTPFHPMVQVSKIMSKRYEDRTAYVANFVRYNKILEFLRDNESKLTKEGLMTKDRAKGLHLMKDELLESLCFLPFKQKIFSEDSENNYVFSYEDIVENTWRLIQKKRKKK